MVSQADIEKFMREYGNRMIQVFGYGAEELPEWAVDVIDYLVSQGKVAFHSGWLYAAEGGEAVQLSHDPKHGLWIVVTHGGVPGAEWESVGVFDSKQKAVEEVESTLRYWIDEIKQRMENAEEAGDYEDVEHYEGELEDIKHDLRRLRKYFR